MQVRNDRGTEWRCRTLGRALRGLDPRNPRTELIRSALEGARTVAEAERSTLFLLSEDGLSLAGHAMAGPDVKGLRCGIDQGIAGACFRSGESIVIPDAWLDPRHERRIDQETGFDTHSIVAVPLLDGRLRPKGVIEAISSQVGVFGPADAEMLLCFGPPILFALSANEEIRRVPSAIVPVVSPSDIPLGESRIWRNLLGRAQAIASAPGNVLLLGETGSGKEVVARFLHRASARARGPFVVVDCTTLTETLAESQLFGHVKGAFTGADRDMKGYLEEADGGTLFLDECGELPKRLQAKLLRVTQEKAFHRVGDPKPIHVDVRFVAATNRRVAPGAEGSAMRDDVYYRLAIHRLTLPPLRDRGQDSWLIFLRKLEEQFGPEVRVTPEVKALVLSHPWPGNVRELLAAAEQAALWARGCEEVRVEHLREALAPPDGVAGTLPAWMCTIPLTERLAIVERLSLAQALARHDDNRSQAAKELGLTRRGLQRACRRHGL